MATTDRPHILTPPRSGEVHLKRCACGKHFECGARTGLCWCAHFPHVIALPGNDNAACLCPSCLQERIVQQQQQQQG